MSVSPDTPILVELRRVEARLAERIGCCEKKLDQVRTKDLPDLRTQVTADIAALRVKAGIWYAVLAAVPGLSALLLVLLQ